MEILTDIRSSIGWDKADMIKKICAPLFHHLSIKYFDFARIIDNKKMLVLFTDSEYVNFFLRHEAYKNTPPPIHFPGKHLWQAYINEIFLSDVKSNFNYGQGITIVKKYKQYSDIFNFSTAYDNKEILNIYLNHYELLEKFIDYFLKNIQPILDNLTQKDFILLRNEVAKFSEEEQRKTILPLPVTNDFHLQVEGQYIPISTRELQCVSLLLIGKTAKEIGRILNISNRTVETYCDKIREKTNSNNRLELLGKIENKLALKEFMLSELNVL